MSGPARGERRAEDEARTLERLEEARGSRAERRAAALLLAPALLRGAPTRIASESPTVR